MRILHIITRLDSGGSATNTIVSVDLLRKHGFETALAYGATNDPDGSIEATLAALGFPRFHLPNLVRDPSPIRDLLAARDIGRLLKRERFALVHTHTSKAGVLGRLAANRSRVPVVHTPHGHIFYGYFGPILTKLFVVVERFMARKTDRIISLTDIETQESLQRGIGRPEQYVTVHSGVPLARFKRKQPDRGKAFRAQAGIPGDALLFASVGRLERVKGFDVLLDAFAKANFPKSAYLVIIGDGREKAALTARASELRITGRVRFVGELKDICDALSAADAFALTSRNEGMGRAFIEAMAAGLPVVGTAVGGVLSIIRDGDTGFLVPAEDAAAAARALEKLSNDGLRAQMGRRAADFVYPEYDEQTMIERLANVYREVLKSRQ